MKKLVFLSMFGLMSVGAFASNGEEAPKLPEAKVETIENSVETVEAKTEDNAVRAEITVNCEDGSSYIVSCDTCPPLPRESLRVVLQFKTLKNTNIV